MPFDLPLPSPLTSIVRQQQFRFTPIPETAGIGRRRDEAGARQIEITLARAFLGHASRDILADREGKYGPCPLGLCGLDRVPSQASLPLFD